MRGTRCDRNSSESCFRMPVYLRHGIRKMDLHCSQECLTADMDHRPGRFEESRFADVVPGFFLDYGLNDKVAEIFVGGALAHFAVEVVFDVGEEAGADFAVRGEADAAAGSAEGLGYGGDDADFTETGLSRVVLEAVAAGGFAGGVGREGAEGEDFAQALDDFAQGDDHLRGPEAIFFEGHEFDEADDDVFAAGEFAEGFDLVIVEAAKEDAVDFYAFEAGLLGGADAADDGGVAAGDAGDALEGWLVDGIHADGDAAQPGFLEGSCEVFEKMPIGGDGDVEAVAGGGAPGG